MDIIEKLNRHIRFDNGKLGSITMNGGIEPLFADVNKETEKAVQIQWLGKMHWLPKSAFKIYYDSDNPSDICWSFKKWAYDKIMSNVKNNRAY